MDINKLFKSVELSVGKILDILPKEDIISKKQFLTDVLNSFTLPSLDIVFPRIKTLILYKDQLIPCDEFSENDDYVTYRIPMELTDGREIMSIKRFCVGPFNNSDFHHHHHGNCLPIRGNRYGRITSASMYEAAAMTQLQYADAQLMGQLTKSLTYYFYPPNKISFNSKFDDCVTYKIIACIQNDPNLVSIPNTAYEGIRKLFLLDVKMTIYNQYKLFDEIDTPYGNLKTLISDWSGCEQERNELYEMYNSTKHFRTSSVRNG